MGPYYRLRNSSALLSGHPQRDPQILETAMLITMHADPEVRMLFLSGVAYSHPKAENEKHTERNYIYLWVDLLKNREAIAEIRLGPK